MIKPLTGLKKIGLSLLDGGKQVRLYFHFDENNTEVPHPIAMQLDSGDLMALMVALQRFQANHKIPIPPNLRPQGRPFLSIVSDSGDLI